MELYFSIVLIVFVLLAYIIQQDEWYTGARIYLTIISIFLALAFPATILFSIVLYFTTQQEFFDEQN